MIEAGHYHLVGAAGVGMSALAQVLLAEGCEVSGSDRSCDVGEEPDVVRRLRIAGVRFHPQDGAGLTGTTHAVVVSTAIEEDNADLARASELGLPVLHRSEMLARLVEGRACVAVTGTSGKSTVTGMIGWILECLGAEPVVVNGAPVLNWRDDEHIGNVRVGGAKGQRRDARDEIWIVEADESDRSLLNLYPDWAVITNVSKDHFGIEETVELFDLFRAQARRGTVSMIDEQGLPDGFDPTVTGDGSSFRYAEVDFTIGLPGRHNALNALCATMLCERLGYALQDVSRAVALFKGVERRLERVGSASGVTVVDDYAHNPAKIRAAWEALAPYCSRLLAVWRPHGFGPLKMLMCDLAETFGALVRPCDRLFVLPVYDAGGTADRSVRAGMLVDKLRDNRVPAVLAANPAEAVQQIVKEARPGDIVLTMGARDPGLPAMARHILRELASAGS